MSSETLDQELISPDFWLLKFDETEFWSDAVKAQVKRVWGIYLVDASMHTYCCESIPSYWLRHVETYTEHYLETLDKVKEEIDNLIAQDDGGDSNSYYKHVPDLSSSWRKEEEEPFDKLPPEQKMHLSGGGRSFGERPVAMTMRSVCSDELREALYEELVEEVLEFARSNQLL